ncbi:MAG: sulfite exporter TauE/SafE family protein [Nitrospiraceae bacterium]|nr:MAG: sulfite exporter TauE/SafE family protein [Nitrospiraceae bacterium]
MITYILISLIFLAAGIVQGISGFGSALIAMPLLTVFIDVKSAVPLCILQSVLITSYLSLQLRDHMEWRKIQPLLLGCLPGIYIGVTVLIKVPSELIKLLLGAVIASYGLYSLVYRPGFRRVGSGWAYAAGFGTGVIGSAFSAGGPPAIIYTTLTGWSRDSIKATLTGFFFASAVITAVVHAASGLTSATVLRYFAASAPAVMAGVYMGSRLYNRFSRHGYIKAILILLILLGLSMGVSAVRGMT